MKTTRFWNQDRALLATVIAVAAAAAWLAMDFPGRARIYPLTVAIGAALCGFAAFLRGASPGPESEAQATERTRGLTLADVIRVCGYLSWIIGYYVLVAIIGFVAAAGVFVSCFLLAVARIRPSIALAAGLGVITFLIGLGYWLDLRWPSSVLDLARWLN